MEWTEDDIWAFLAGTGTPYNPIYDRMAAVGIPRSEWRVSTLLGESGRQFGRFARLRVISPEMYRPLAAQFPAVTRDT